VFAAERCVLAAGEEMIMMKNKRSGVIAAAALMALTIPVSAGAPTVTITSPTAAATVYSATFPFTQSIAFTVHHDDVQGQPRNISDVRNLEVLIDGVTIAGADVEEPWKKANAPGCNLKGDPFAAPYTGCVVEDDYTGKGTINWSVPAPGTYAITVRVKHASETGEDVESVQFALLNAEFPAPPAVANAYINANLKAGSAKVRGCVIAKIAEKHAKESAYGPKGGPYNTSWIQDDVSSFWAQCGGGL
jgi:hypothetical protein